MPGLIITTKLWFYALIAMLGISTSSNASRLRDAIDELQRLRPIFKHELLLRDERIRQASVFWLPLYLSSQSLQQIIANSTNNLHVDGKIQRDPIDRIVSYSPSSIDTLGCSISLSFHKVDAVADLDTQPILSSQIAAKISSCSPALLAEVREWQQVSSLSFALNALLLSFVFSGGLCLRYGSFSSQFQESSLHVHSPACFDTAIPFISGTMTLPPDPLADRICDAMLATILAFPLPSGTQPAQPRPDDLERIMDCRVLYDEPRMRTLIASFDDSSQRSLEAASDRERSRLPLFPGHFSVWDPDCLDKRSNPFDSGEWMYYQLILFLSFVVRCESVP